MQQNGDMINDIGVHLYSDENPFYLEPEDDAGNTEYKYKLTDLSESTLENRVTQMNFRLDEGNGEAIYQIGVTDDGCPLGLNSEKLEETIKNLKYIASKLTASIQMIDKSESPINLLNDTNKQMYINCNRFDKKTIPNIVLDEPRYVCEFLVRRITHNNNYVGLRIAVAGNVDAGKSTTIGVLTQGMNDDGKGGARKHVFNHQHEIISGRTTSVSQEIMGFDENGDVVNEKLRKLKPPTWPEIVRASHKICSFYDMAGHEKYFNVTIRGMSGVFPDYCMIMIGSNMGITQMTREHMIICLMRQIPMIVIFTKIDMAPEHVLKKNMTELTKLITGAGVNKTPYNVKSKRDVINCCHNISSGVIVPIIKLSNVTGENMDLLKIMLNCLPSRTNYHNHLNKPSKYTIQETFLVSGIGTVVNGFLQAGVVSVKNTMWLGPYSDGRFKKVTIKSIHDKRTDVTNAFAGQSVCFALRGIERTEIKKGMVLIDGNQQEPNCVTEFDAEIEIFGKHSTSIRVGYEPVIHIENVSQSAKLMKIDNVVRKSSTHATLEAYDKKGDLVIRSGDRAFVRFKFCHNPVYIEEGLKMLFREGKTRGVGIIEKVYKIHS
jgi:GTPase